MSFKIRWKKFHEIMNKMFGNLITKICETQAIQGSAVN